MKNTWGPWGEKNDALSSTTPSGWYFCYAGAPKPAKCLVRHLCRRNKRGTYTLLTLLPTTIFLVNTKARSWCLLYRTFARAMRQSDFCLPLDQGTIGWHYLPAPQRARAQGSCPHHDWNHSPTCYRYVLCLSQRPCARNTCIERIHRTGQRRRWIMPVWVGMSQGETETIEDRFCWFCIKQGITTFLV